MPYLTSLANSYGVGTNYFADTHPSIGNYFAFSTGRILTNFDSETPLTFPVAADNIALEVQRAGKTWKDYVENLPSVLGCGGLKSGSYYSHHDPLAYMTTVNTEANHFVCFSQFATDVANRALPNLSWLVPNGCDGGDDCGYAAFDNWLKVEIPPLLASSYFQPGGDGLLVIVFDENSSTTNSCGLTMGTGCGGQVEVVMVSPHSLEGFKSNGSYEHENVLRTIAQGLGLNTSGLGAAASAIPMADFFGAPAATSALAQVQNNLDTNTSNHYTSFSVNISTSPGDLLVAFCRESSNGTDNFTVTDSAGQNWTLTPSGYKNESSTGPRLGMFYRANSAAVTRVTAHFTTSGGVIVPSIMVMEISGAASSGVLDASVNAGTAGDTTTSPSGKLTTTNASDILIFGTDAAGNESSWVAGAGYTIPKNGVTTGASGSNARMAMQFAVVNTLLNGVPTSMAYSSAAWNSNVFGAFKLGTSSAGTTSSSPPTLVQVQNNLDTGTTAHASFSVPIATHPGDLLVAFVREDSNVADNFTVSDSAGQTWAQTASGYANESSTGPRLGLFYKANSASVSSVTAHFTTSGGALRPGMMVMEFSGGATSGVADGSVNHGSGGEASASLSGILSTANANDILILATDAAGNEGSWTPGSGYAIPNNKVTLGASGSNARMAAQFARVSSLQNNTSTAMSYAAPNWNGNIFAAFK